MNSASSLLLILGLVNTLLLMSGSVDKGAIAGGAPFVNVTEESGVMEAIKLHYENVPNWWLSGIDLIDLDGDGDLDLHLASHRGTSAGAAFNDGRGHFTYVDPQLSIPRGVREDEDVPYPGGEIRLAFDFNEDGKVDLLSSWGDDMGCLYLNDCRAGDPPAWNFRRSRTLDQFNRATAMADMNRDGNVDYLADKGARREPDQYVLILLGEGNGTFEKELLVPEAMKESCGIPVDIDDDGDLDLLVSQRGYNPPGRRLLLNDGNLNFTNVSKERGLEETTGSIHGAGDVDQDGDMDLICVEDSEVAIYLNDGQGSFIREAGNMNVSAKSTNWGGAIVTDFDNDGLADIIINGKYFLYVLRGTGDGKFTSSNETWGLPTRAWSAVDEGLCFGDIDSDGDLDLFACSSGPEGKEKGIAVFRNELPKQHWIRVRPIGKRGNRAATGAKIRIYESGNMGNPDHLLWYEQVGIWGRQSFHSYYTGVVTERHFGLGQREDVDVSVEFYPSGKRMESRRVKTNTTVQVVEE